MRKYSTVACAALVLVMFAAAGLAQEKVAPSDAYKSVMSGARAKNPKSYEEYQAALKELATAALGTIQTENLNDAEQIAYGDLLNLAGKAPDASAIFEKIAKSDAPAANDACKRLMNIANETKDYEKLAAMIESHRKRFPVSPDDPAGMFQQVMALAQHYSEAGDSAKAVEVILAELNTLKFDYPYNSFSLLNYTQDDFDKAGKSAEYLALLKQYKAKFDEAVAARAAGEPADADAKKKYDQVTNLWTRFSRGYAGTLTRAELIGKEAPDFELSNYFNTTPITLKDLRGKVIMVDFWANWCGPCKAAFPSMAELYAEYKDKGFVILGVTSLQGYFADGDVREGLKTRDLPAEREMALTKDFIANHKMTWPIAFSSRGCFDPAYGIQGIPTFAVIDKKGVVRLLQVGSGPESEAKLKVLVPKLLAED